MKWIGNGEVRADNESCETVKRGIRGQMKTAVYSKMANNTDRGDCRKRQLSNSYRFCNIDFVHSLRELGAAVRPG